jgi:hypothetical protein
MRLAVPAVMNRLVNATLCYARSRHALNNGCHYIYGSRMYCFLPFRSLAGPQLRVSFLRQELVQQRVVLNNANRQILDFYQRKFLAWAESGNICLFI